MSDVMNGYGNTDRRSSFKDILATALERNPSVAHMDQTVQKELLHYDILDIMSRQGWLDGLTFMGGTALRLCYRAPRLSEDIDFSGGPDFTADRMKGLATDLKDGLSRLDSLDGLNIEVKEPKPVNVSDMTETGVMSWRISVETYPGRRRQRIKIDVDRSPSHTARPEVIVPNYDVVRDSGSVIHVQSREEILASKLVAFPVSVATRNSPRYRDIWDIHWLAGRRIMVVPDLVRAKASAHDMERDWINAAADRVQTIVRSPRFDSEMRRFLPLDIAERSLDNPSYLEALANRTVSLLKDADACLDPLEYGQEHGNPFATPDPSRRSSPFD